MDRDKLAKFRKQKAEQKAELNKQLLESNASIKDALLALNESINAQEPFDDTRLYQQLGELKSSFTFKADIERLEGVLKESLKNDKLEDLIDKIGDINNSDVVEVVNELIAKLEDNKISQDPKDYQPVRRVRKVNNVFVFDDDPMSATFMGGGGGGSSFQDSSGKSVRAELTQLGQVPVAPSADWDYMSVVNSNTDEDTLTYKLGGSGGNTIRTLVIGYSAGAEKVSDSIASLDYS